MRLYGRNLMAVLHFTQSVCPNKTAIIDSNHKISYRQLYLSSYQFAERLNRNIGFKKAKKIGLFIENEIAFVQVLCACSILGKKTILLQSDYKKVQFEQLINDNIVDFIFTNDEQLAFCENYLPKTQLYSIANIKNGIKDDFNAPLRSLAKCNSSQIVMMTSGTTGKPKSIEHDTKPSPPFLLYYNLLFKLKLIRYDRAFIATPLYHSYGLSTLLTGLILGYTIHLSHSFKTENSIKIIKDYKIDLITLVPTQVQRLLAFSDENFKSIKCIITGSAPLSNSSIQGINTRFGHILYNLYGSSETGMISAAKPSQLEKFGNTVGKALWGVKIRIKNQKGLSLKANTAGQIWVKNNWGLSRFRNKWIQTGDIGYLNNEGLLFISGRADDLIISGGKNIYPAELEGILEQHEAVEKSVVIGIADDDFGQRLKVFIVLKKAIDIELLKAYLKNNAPKHLQAKTIVILEELPLNNIGKIDRKALINQKEK